MLYDFKNLVSKAELEPMIKLSQYCGIGVDFENLTEAKIRNFIKDIQIDPKAPEGNLVMKKSLLKRDVGKLKKFKASTAVVTMDKFFYVFNWSLKNTNQLTDPKLCLNCSKDIQTISQREKDLLIVLTLKKKSFFGKNQK
jgi:hypothetical protein